MPIQKSKDEIISELQRYNKELLSKLDNVTEWMQRNLEEKKKIIENDESSHQVIRKHYDDFFWEYKIKAIDDDIFDDILSSEILYQHMLMDATLDGTSIVIGYNKAVDITLEYCLVKPWREYAHKRSKNFIQSQRAEEKLLHQVVYHGYTISLWKLYGILTQDRENLWFFSELFFQFLDEYSYIKTVILSPNFLEIIGNIVTKEYFWSKRHTGSISLSEVQEVRQAVLGNFENKNCILFLLFTM